MNEFERDRSRQSLPPNARQRLKSLQLDLSRPSANSLARKFRERGVDPALALALGELFENVAYTPSSVPDGIRDDVGSGRAEN